MHSTSGAITKLLAVHVAVTHAAHSTHATVSPAGLSALPRHSHHCAASGFVVVVFTAVTAGAHHFPTGPGAGARDS